MHHHHGEAAQNRVLDPEHDSTNILRNFGNYLPVDSALRLRTLESSATPLT